jgi:hypothetical protein
MVAGCGPLVRRETRKREARSSAPHNQEEDTVELPRGCYTAEWRKSCVDKLSLRLSDSES